MSKLEIRSAYGKKNKVVVETKDALTEQHHKDQCDIGRIIATYDKTGVLTHVNRFEAQYGDLTGVDYQDMVIKVAAANSAFENLPSELRNKFHNDPANFLTYMDTDGNLEEKYDLGLLERPIVVDDSSSSVDGGSAAVEPAQAGETEAT